jgi:uncharacterized SAM-binding protein YcdF (DUF218 family)
MRADAIVVLGCRMEIDGSPTAALRRRVLHGAALLGQSRAPRLVLSGRGRGPGCEAEAMHAIALAEGAPARVLILEDRSADTVGNALECARLLLPLGIQRVILVSDRYHLPRARLLFGLSGFDVVATSAPTPGLDSRWMWLREGLALPRSLWRWRARRVVTPKY